MEKSDNVPVQHLADRLDRVEREVEHHRGLINSLVTKTAVTETVVESINRALEDIRTQIGKTNSTINRVAWLIISALVLAVVGFIVNGGIAGAS